MDKEKLINQIMKECAEDGEPVTREEAEEMAEMELKAKKDCRRYESDKRKVKKPSTREKKIDTEKVRLMELFNYCLLEPNRIDDELPREHPALLGKKRESLLHRKKVEEFSILTLMKKM